MKRNYIFLLGIAVFSFLISCESTNELGFDQSVGMMNFRMVADIASFNSLSSETVNQDVTLTMYSENTDIDKVTVLVEFYQESSKTTYPRFVLTEIAGSSLKNDGSSKVTLTLGDFLTATGVNFNALSGGDKFTIYNIVEMENGLVYPDTVFVDADGDGDLDPQLNIEGSFLAGTSAYVAQLSFPIVCPVTDPFVGNYSVVDDQDFWSGTIVLSSNGGASRKFTGNCLGFADRAFNFDLVCGKIFVANQSVGLACGAAGPLSLITSPTNGPGSYNDLDDTQLTLHLFWNNPGCIGEYEAIVTLTKIP